MESSMPIPLNEHFAFYWKIYPLTLSWRMSMRCQHWENCSEDGCRHVVVTLPAFKNPCCPGWRIFSQPAIRKGLIFIRVCGFSITSLHSLFMPSAKLFERIFWAYGLSLVVPLAGLHVLVSIHLIFSEKMFMLHKYKNMITYLHSVHPVVYYNM
jgi:hypothetical protein